MRRNSKIHSAQVCQPRTRIQAHPRYTTAAEYRAVAWPTVNGGKVQFAWVVCGEGNTRLDFGNFCLLTNFICTVHVQYGQISTIYHLARWHRKFKTRWLVSTTHVRRAAARSSMKVGMTSFTEMPNIGSTIVATTPETT